MKCAFFLYWQHVCLLSLLLMVSCTAQPKSLSSSPSLPEGPYRWIAAVPCAPPCWENITPGKTLYIQLQDIFHHSPISTAVTLMADFERNTSKAGNERLITVLSITYAQSFTLESVIDAYGEPTDVIAEVNTPFYYLTLVYQHHGFAISIGNQDHIKPKLTLDTHFNGLMVFPADHLDMTPLIHQKQLLTPWQGLRDFDFYCRDEVGGAACRGER